MKSVLRLTLLALAVGFAVAPAIASAQSGPGPYECGAEPSDPDSEWPDASQCPGGGGNNPPPPPPPDPCGTFPWFCHEN